MRTIRIVNHIYLLKIAKNRSFAFSRPLHTKNLAGDRMGTPLGAEGVRFIVKARCAAAGL